MEVYRLPEYVKTDYDNELYHFGIKNQKWGIRRYQNPDGSLTPAGKARYKRIENKEYRLTMKSYRERDRIEKKYNAGKESYNDLINSKKYKNWEKKQKALNKEMSNEYKAFRDDVKKENEKYASKDKEKLNSYKDKEIAKLQKTQEAYDKYYNKHNEKLSKNPEKNEKKIKKLQENYIKGKDEVSKQMNAVKNMTYADMKTEKSLKRKEYLGQAAAHAALMTIMVHPVGLAAIAGTAAGAMSGAYAADSLLGTPSKKVKDYRLQKK